MIINRKNTKKVMVGNVQIGNNNNVVIQSMTNTKTSDVDATLKQINELVKNGCELVRVAVLDNDDCLAIKKITSKSPCPIICDIHYNYQFAISAIESGAKKIRINPANIKDESQLHQIVNCAKKHNVAIRIGFNKGSYAKISNSDLIKSVIRYIKKFET
jgi:(E)-4-hydroxy-3-methylbut-2-enyl-diphosphate synthase